MAQFIEVRAEDGEKVLINTDEIVYIGEKSLKFKSVTDGYHIIDTFNWIDYDYEDVKRQLNLQEKKQ